jgi:hypothetical protein
LRDNENALVADLGLVGGDLIIVGVIEIGLDFGIGLDGVRWHVSLLRLCASQARVRAIR